MLLECEFGCLELCARDINLGGWIMLRGGRFGAPFDLFKHEFRLDESRGIAHLSAALLVDSQKEFSIAPESKLEMRYTALKSNKEDGLQELIDDLNVLKWSPYPQEMNGQSIRVYLVSPSRASKLVCLWHL